MNRSDHRRPPRTSTALLGVGLALVIAGLVVSGLPGPSTLRPTVRAPGPSTVRALAGTAASAQWRSLETPTGFPGLFNPSLAPDPADNATILFGGCTGVLCPPGATNATWRFADGSWTRLDLAIHPSARTEAQMAWDPADRAILLFGGDGCLDPPACTLNGPLNDTWEFSGGQWSQIPTTTAPPPTRQGALAYDPSSQQMVLFGGFLCFTGCTTWTFSAGTWAALNLSTAPPFRYAEGFAEDDADNGALLFGGVGSNGGYLSDTWLYASGVWRPMSGTTHPAQREAPAMAWDPTLGSVVLFGGDYVTLSNFPGVTYADTWTFSAGGWTPWNGGGGSPGARDSAAGATDPGSGVYLLVGGCGPSGCPYADTWALGPLVSVNLSSPSPGCVHLLLGGAAYTLNATASLERGTYPLNISACAGDTVFNVTASAGLAVSRTSENGTFWNGTVWLAQSGSITVKVSSPAPSGPPGGGSGASAAGGLLSPPINLYLTVTAVALAVVDGLAIVVTRRKPPSVGAAPADPSTGGSPGPHGE